MVECKLACTLLILHFCLSLKTFCPWIVGPDGFDMGAGQPAIGHQTARN